MRLKLSISFMAPETMNPCYSPKNNSRGGRCSIPAGDSFGQGQMVPRKGLDPSRPLSHWHLKPARLPIPPPGPGPVSTDRPRACQMGARARQIYCTARVRWRIAKRLHIGYERNLNPGIEPHGIESGYA